MFDGYIFTEGSLANVEVDGEVIGYEMRTRIPYYRGIPLSMVHDVEVEVDGAAVAREDIRFTADGGEHWWTLAEMETVTSFRWEYEDEATVRVLAPGGLAPGEHEVLLRVSARVAYIPVPFSGEMRRTVTIG
ncbi:MULTISPECIES: DUF6379 domain-containing protein [unclassified Actinomyces]|uniref:C-glycoside deglycosidase beta subunit domain-containing protein n=1 Tax=unclassified Actinomyces TaxID=2609248 RepID=UPI002016CA9E|nr:MULTISPECIES: DUF6379 domain-containing protein [unclassified Actinomyces]MCL3777439.1 hypothetical protein [Actinomyces sp. AC-20-1]MCL3789744.1 hypothetical protein [Actinomyces sp. 187325]MCL3792118.1 hypothetical protein [Actinomyces sp. 186855]MCL3794798.1 hypothetical protein [Actinomyces sp. 217892]